MSKIRVQLAKPYFDNDDIEMYKKLVEEILRSGRLTLGKYLELFEAKLAEYVGVRYAVAMNSATSALHSAMLALKIGPGDEVIVPSYTFASTVNAPIYVNARPVLVDSDLDTFNISVDDVLEKIRPGKTKAIIPVHIGGNPVDMKPLLEIAEDYNILIVEDAAHALGAYYRGRHAGTFGIIGVFSFYPNKIITTGEGGAAVTDDQRCAERLRLIRNVGRSSLGPVDVITLGYNFRMSELNAALGIVQMRKLNYILERRRALARLYDKLIDSRLSDIVKRQVITRDSIPSYYAYIVRLECGRACRDAVRDHLLRRYGIETTIIYRPVHTMPYYRRLFGEIRLSNAELLGESNIALPLHPSMTERDVEYVINALEETINAFLKK